MENRTEVTRAVQRQDQREATYWDPGEEQPGTGASREVRSREYSRAGEEDRDGNWVINQCIITG